MAITLVLAILVASAAFGVMARRVKAGSWMEPHHHGICRIRLLASPVCVVGYVWPTFSRCRFGPSSGTGLYAAVCRCLAVVAEPDPAGRGPRYAVYIALIARITRASMLEVLQQDYVAPPAPEAWTSAASCTFTR